jgi:hypothetical protein
MSNRPRHPNKEIEAAVKYAEANGWTCVVPAKHAWGRLLCPRSGRDGCLHSVWSTPRSPENFADYLRRCVKKCPHMPGGAKP